MAPERTLTLGVILPHTKIFGGVKRFFEIGNILIRKGHQFIVFTPDGHPPDWFDFVGRVIALDKISSFSFDALFITQPDYIEQLKKARTELRIFYAILQRHSYLKRIQGVPGLIILANSTRLYARLKRSAKTNVIKAIGGVDTNKFYVVRKLVHDPFIVMAYGRFYKSKKGTMLVVRACERLYRKGYNIKLHLFDSPTDSYGHEQLRKFTCKVPFELFLNYPVKNLAELYQKADLFVSAERNAGWSNTSAEAMACGTPVIATRSGTEDFLIHKETGLLVWRHRWFIERAIKKMYSDPSLRDRLSLNGRKKIEEFSWLNLTESIISVLQHSLSVRRKQI